MRMRVTISRFASLAVAIGAVVACACPDASAKTTTKKKRLLPDAYYGLFGAPKREVRDDSEAQMLINKLARDPSLMNVEYLRHLIGRPHNEHQVKYRLSPHYIWYDAHNQPLYELQLNQQVQGQVTGAQMLFHLHGMAVRFDKLAATYGQPVRRCFNQQARPSEVFSLAPGTFLSFSSEPNTFTCNQAQIMYSGPPLPPPSPTEMSLAQASLLARGQMLVQDGALDGQFLPVVEARVKNSPMDPEAHLALGTAYKQQNQVHAAIAEYKTALSLSAGNDAAREKAIAALRAMHVIADYDPNMRRPLQMAPHGQGLRALRAEKQEGK